MKYIGVKIVEAVSMNAVEASKRGHQTSERNPDEDGYEVTYQGGYKSWCPQDVFEAANFPLEDGTKITEGDVARMMGPLSGEQISPKSTLVSAKRSLIGFETFNVSSCVDPANYDTAMGVKFGSGPIVDEFWQCLGFVLQWAKNGLNYPKQVESSLPDYQQRVIAEKALLDDKINKLDTFISDPNKFNELPGDERVRLTNQHAYMSDYSAVLGDRIIAFD